MATVVMHAQIDVHTRARTHARKQANTNTHTLISICHLLPHVET